MEPQILSSYNPATGLEIKQYKSLTAEQVGKNLKKAHKAYTQWRSSAMKERTALLRSVAKSIRKHSDAAALLATREMGKPIAQSRAELEKCAKTFEYYATEGPRMLQDELIFSEGKRKGYVSFQPIGVVLAVMPWNFPYWQVFRAMAPVLMSGNAMVLKHASNVSGCAMMIEKIMKDAGVPAHLYQTLLIASSAVASVIAAPEVAAVTFTGSTAAGRKVASVAADNLKKQVLELGGSDAYLILEDADVAEAARMCLEARMINTGQSCVAAKRFIAVKSVRKSFEAALSELIKQVTYGNPEDPAQQIGPMARPDLRKELHSQVTDSIAAGARLLHGGFIPEGPGAYYPPTLLTNVKPGMPAYSEELFGPVAVIIEAKDEADAIRIANSSEYGLGGAVFSRNRKRAEKIARELLDAGSCFVNEAVHSDPRLPFGGVKHSGYGRELSSFALREFVNIKTVVLG
ncbi:NAD-dependent succinate-semialdehyde dehydrogenase [Rurimicrobium arvi]|uniref:NAD-dependent succinate-semialdehyde dehydrogenase n=1 Tax=Rurimicrobium arvi TaxID=2049916 RepID=A0ABP8MPZ9_9BACT